MVSNFDLVKLHELLKHFYTIAHIRITIFDGDFTEIVSYPEEIPEFCRLIRSNEEGARQCALCDQNACIYAGDFQKPYVYRCHAGLTEAIMPITLGKLVIGYMIFGHIASSPDQEQGWIEVLENCRNYGIEEGRLHSAYLDRPYYSNEYIESASQLMLAVSSYLCVSHMATLKRDGLPIQIDQYIHQQLQHEISSETICERFHISRAKLYQLSMSNFGMGITEYIRKLRIQKAQELLTDTDDPVSQIAAQVGIIDYNYFTKVFKKEVGVTPSQYRKKQYSK